MALKPLSPRGAMPAPQRQQPAPVASRLSLIKHGIQRKPAWLVVYGPEKIGKSTMGMEAKDHIFVPTEDRVSNLNVSSFDCAKTFIEFIGNLQALQNEQHKYRVCVIDSLDALERLIWAHTCEVSGKDSIEKFGYGKGYVEALKYWVAVITILSDLRNRLGMTILCIAHSNLDTVEPPEADAYKQHAPAIHKKAWALWAQVVDAILFATTKIVVRKNEDGKAKARAVGADGGERVLFTGKNPAYVAGNCFNFPPEIPMGTKDEPVAWAWIEYYIEEFYKAGGQVEDQHLGPADHTFMGPLGNNLPVEENHAGVTDEQIDNMSPEEYDRFRKQAADEMAYVALEFRKEHARLKGRVPREPGEDGAYHDPVYANEELPPDEDKSTPF